MQKKILVIIGSILVGWGVVSTVCAIYYAHRFIAYKNAESERTTQRERELELQLQSLSAELETARLKAADLERSIQSIHERVGKLGELNQAIESTVSQLTGTNRTLAAISRPYSSS